MELSEFGEFVETEIRIIPEYNPRIILDEWQVTPNHQWWYNHDYKPTIDEIKQYRKQRQKMIIPKILGKLQMKTSKQMNDARKTPGKKNWQSDYHDHIIRDDQSYLRIKKYIRNNPENWNDDKFNDPEI